MKQKKKKEFQINDRFLPVVESKMWALYFLNSPNCWDEDVEIEVNFVVQTAVDFEATTKAADSGEIVAVLALSAIVAG